MSKKANKAAKIVAVASLAPVAAPQQAETEVKAPKVRKARLIKGTLVAHFAEYVKVTTATGNKSYDSGDKVAVRLRGLELDAVYAEAATVLKTPEAELRAKYARLNAGMQRMNLGNRIRAAIAKQP
jgi:hypothetical protein